MADEVKAQVFSDEELKAISDFPKENPLSWLLLNRNRFLSTIAADRQQNEILKTDLHIANRALEIHPDTVELRKQVIADRKRNEELEEKLKNVESDLEDYKFFVKQRNKTIADQAATIERMNKKVCKAIYYLMKDSPRYRDGRSKEVSYFQDGMDRLIEVKKLARKALAERRK